MGVISALKATVGVASATTGPRLKGKVTSTYIDSSVDSYSSNLSILLNGEDFIDKGTSPKSISNSSVATNTSIKKFGSSSLYFNGSSQLSVPNNAAFNFDSGDFTVEFWLYSPVAWTSQPGSTGIVGQKANDSTNGWVIYRDGGYSDKLNARLSQQNNFPTTSTPTQNTWEHWALVRNGTSLKWYKNGVVDASTTNSSAVTDSSGAFYVGYAQTWGGYFNGYIDELRITKGVARYTSNFTVPTTAFPVVPPPVTLYASTSNTTSTSTRGDGPMAQFFSSSSYGIFSSVSAGHYLRVDYGTPYAVKTVVYRNAVGSSWAPTSVLVRYSTDGSTWYTAATYSDNASTSNQTISISGITARYWQLYQNSSTRQGSGGYEWHMNNFAMY
jgi:hypothetical protein